MLQGKKLRCAIHPVLTSTFIKNKRACIKINKPRVMLMRIRKGGWVVSSEGKERERKRKKEERTQIDFHIQPISQIFMRKQTTKMT